MVRQFKFKAWNKDTKLLMRLNQIDCVKGVLVKEDHILLQFTGLHDKSGSEIYEEDILLFGTNKAIVKWDMSKFSWVLINESDGSERPFNSNEMKKSVKLCSFLESPDSFLIK